jgi:hypothetical protein
MRVNIPMAPANIDNTPADFNQSFDKLWFDLQIRPPRFDDIHGTIPLSRCPMSQLFKTGAQKALARHARSTMAMRALVQGWLEWEQPARAHAMDLVHGDDLDELLRILDHFITPGLSVITDRMRAEYSEQGDKRWLFFSHGLEKAYLSMAVSALHFMKSGLRQARALTADPDLTEHSQPAALKQAFKYFAALDPEETNRQPHLILAYPAAEMTRFVFVWLGRLLLDYEKQFNNQQPISPDHFQAASNDFERIMAQIAASHRSSAVLQDLQIAFQQKPVFDFTTDETGKLTIAPRPIEKDSIKASLGAQCPEVQAFVLELMNNRASEPYSAGCPARFTLSSNGTSLIHWAYHRFYLPEINQALFEPNPYRAMPIIVVGPRPLTS